MTFSPLSKVLSALAVLSVPVWGHAVSWVGNTRVLQGTHPLPARGSFVEPGMPVTLVTETFPIESGQRVVAVVTTDNWQTTREYEFTFDGNVGNNTRWAVVLPSFPGNTRLDVYLRADGPGGPRFDNNAWANFGVFVRPAPPQRRGAILQWFETDYTEILRRLPEILDAGYTALYLPSPVKSGGGGFSVGYNPFDRFDLGDRPQKGSTRTKYGTTQELITLVQTAQRFGLEVYADLVLNHNDNRANSGIATYPDVLPEDFHIRSSADPGNREVDFNSESAFTFGMLNHDLLGLADLAPEDGNLIQSGTFTLPTFASWSPNGKPQFVRHPLTPAYYPDGVPVSEDIGTYLKRWTTWLATSIGFDGFRLDAVKHMAPPALGWAPDQPTGGAAFSSGNLLNDLAFRAPGRTIFGEVYSGNLYELREFAKTGQNLLDFPLKFLMGDVFNANGFGDLRRLSNGYGRDGATGLPTQQGGLAPEISVPFVQSHDDGPPESNHLAHAFVMTRVGRPKVYYDGNRIQPGNWSHFPRPGRGDALRRGSVVTRLADANARFGRGVVFNRWTADRLYVYERVQNGAGLMLVGLNNRSDAGEQTVTVQTAFLPGTILEDLMGRMPDRAVDASGRVQVTVPNNFSATEPDNGTGFVVYAPRTPRAPVGEPALRLLDPTRRGAWLPRETTTLPTGPYGIAQTTTSWTVTTDRVDLEARFTGNPTSVLLRLNNGQPLAGRVPLSLTPEGLADGFVPMERQRDGVWTLPGVDLSGLPNGLHAVRVRAFSNPTGRPGLFQDFTAYLSVRRSGPNAPDGRLEEYGPALATQSRSASSSANRLDALYVLNDADVLTVGIAGRVDASPAFTNGVAVALDTVAGGIADLADLADDSGPAARLMTNTRLRFPNGFGADAFLASVQGSTLSSAPEMGFPGEPVQTPRVGAFAGALAPLVNSPLSMRPLPVAVAYVPRTSLGQTPRGWEFAVPLSALFPQGITPGARVRLMAWLGTTGEATTTLDARDPLRGMLGGRPAPNPWLTNQFLPVQPSVTSDPGRNTVTASAVSEWTLRQASPVASGAARITLGEPRRGERRGTTVRTVTVEHLGPSAWSGPVRLRAQVPAGVQVMAPWRPSLTQPRSGWVTLSPTAVAPGRGFTVNLELQGAGTGAPSFEVLTGQGAL